MPFCGNIPFVTCDSIFMLTCLPAALKGVDFTGFSFIFLCQRS